MNRKLFALIVFIGGIGALVLIYIYFFVFYTSTIVIDANIEQYSVELFSKKTAQKWTHECQSKLCTLSDVAPLEYSISIYATGYKTESFTETIRARKEYTFVTQMEKNPELRLLDEMTPEESIEEKITRIRDENNSYKRFFLSEENTVVFHKREDVLDMYIQEKFIESFPLVPRERLYAGYIDTSGGDIFLKIANTTYIFQETTSTLHTLPYTIDVYYIKPTIALGNYLVVTEKGTFSYDIATKKSRYEYMFRDFVYYQDSLIGVIYDDEIQKKKNFSLTESGNLIVLYNQDSKQRKVLMKTDLQVDRIVLQNGQPVLGAGDTNYILENF